MEEPHRTYVIDVRFRDMDSMGHVNNAVFFTYIEEARVRYFQELAAANPDAVSVGAILAMAKVDYKRPLYHGDTVEVRVRGTFLGNSSAGLAYEVWSRTQQAAAATAESVHVAYDYEAGRPVPFTPAMREAIERFEGRKLPGKA